ncbi:MAG: hypothetical protein IKR50_00440 [Prevotella sp.]|nr:hypothetical protein [Prevotella sp.]
MIKKEYMKPVMKGIELQHKSQILAGSVTSVTTTGLDDDLILPDDEEPKSGSVWEEAW